MPRTELENDVLRQALIEYTSRRSCYDPREEEETTLEGVKMYVDVRYLTRTPKFKADKVKSLLPRIRAAYAMLIQISEGS